MGKTPFNRFIDLIQFDQSHDFLEKELEVVMTALDTVQDHLFDYEREYEKERAFVQSLRKEVDAQELEMRSLDEKEKVARERSALATSTKEYQGFKKECDQFKQQQHEHEEVLLAAWSAFEQAQKLFEAKEVAYKEKKVSFQQEIEAYEQKKQALLTQLTEHEEARKSYCVDLPEEWLEKYNRMRNVVSNPVVSLIGGTCGGCSVMLTQPIIIALEQNKLIQCSGCYRLMYKDFDQTQLSTPSS
jgi:predicted  nucleic acid-binding Zn-ribbon protein